MFFRLSWRNQGFFRSLFSRRGVFFSDLDCHHGLLRDWALKGWGTATERIAEGQFEAAQVQSGRRNLSTFDR